VQKEFRRFVEILLYTDGGEENLKNRDFQLERFGTVALPHYVLLDPTGTKVLWEGGGYRSAEEFAASFQLAK
jgi:hypothetical protein